MAGSKSNYLSKAFLNHMLGSWGVTGPTGATAPTGPAGLLPYVYIGLWTSPQSLSDSSSGNAGGEVQSTVSASDTGYRRVKIANNSTNWGAATGSGVAIKQNKIAIVFPTCLIGWGTINQFAILDSETVGTGNVLFWGDITSPKEILAGDTASFSVGSISITED